MQQSRLPDHVFVVGSQASDIAEVEFNAEKITAVVGRVGSSHQRNDGLKMVGNSFDLVVFFDDDFVPSHFWIERMAQIFVAHPDVAGLTGTILDDGSATKGISLAEADVAVRSKDADATVCRTILPRFGYGGNVGCNMAYRVSALGSIRFDENLPRYAWQEDSDFRGQVERRGEFVRALDLWGVHLGHKLGRSSGVALGYAQIANSIYLGRKGTVPRWYMARLAFKNFVANTIKSVFPEPFVDRRGRLKGNLMAFGDLLLGRIAPNRSPKM